MRNLRLLLNLFFRWRHEQRIMLAYGKKYRDQLVHGSLGSHRDLEGITTVYRKAFLWYEGDYHSTLPTRIWKGKLPRKIDKAYWRY